MEKKIASLLLAIAIVATGNVAGGGVSCSIVGNATQVWPTPGKQIETGADPPEIVVASVSEERIVFAKIKIGEAAA